MGPVIIDIPEALTLTETKRVQLNVSRISPAAPIVLAVEVERVQMLAAPVKDDLEDGMEVREGGVAADEESAPDERTDLAQGDTQLIETGRFRWLTHRVSVAQCAVSLKVSPRNLALSRLRDIGSRRLYRSGSIDLHNYPRLQPHITGRINRHRVLDWWDDMLRAAGSMKLGHVTASLLVQKLQA